mmetsp:Transcript_61193/g.71561  ORF Transcript_61193/g.71561 Transcript_61193/m.71561 type:complete len:314 (-) Transcript_61193:747-1688(-)
MDAILSTRSMEECIFQEFVSDGTEHDYLEFSCLYPFYQRTYSWWETTATSDNFLARMVGRNFRFMHSNPVTPVIAIALYGIFIVCGRNYFRDRKPWNLRKTLAMWNFSLSLFSFMGACRLIPHAFHLLYHLPLRESVCGDGGFYFGRGSSGLWTQLFILSKFPELLDTFFIVVHKKPLIFLHWYHHVTVLLYCWAAYVIEIPAGLFFAAMNFAVHSIMYGYYFLMAMKIKPKWFSAIYITLAQVFQMVIGVSVTSLNFYYYFTDNEGTCNLRWQALAAGFTMYGSYLFLFLQFFMGKYNFVGSASKDGKMKYF